MSIFSDHLFRGRRIKAWAFHDGVIPLVHCVFDDGNMVSLTYQREHEMKAWARHEQPAVKYEDVTVHKSTTGQSYAYFQYQKNGQRHVEVSANRQEKDVLWQIAMDATKSTFNNVNASSGGTVSIDILSNPGYPDEYTIVADESIFYDDIPDEGAVGTVYAIFNGDGSISYYEVTQAVYSDLCIVQLISGPPPDSDPSYNITLWGCKKTITGLSHLEGEKVSVVGDGFILASPNNDVNEYNEYTVTGGEITLDNYYAIVHVGRPYTCDEETLDIDTVEQRPTLIESKNVNKLYIKVHESRGIYVSNTFPKNGGVKGMADLEYRGVDYADQDLSDTVVNQAQKPYSRRIEMIIPGDWNSQGRVCLRQVDPVFSQILSIIPDMTDLRRGR